jgi:peptidoglycan/xylan/chitin deacetylase (PgdA/CDA1 family)
MKSRHKIMVALAVLLLGLSVTAGVAISINYSKTNNKVQPITVKAVKNQNNNSITAVKKQQNEEMTFTNTPLIQNDSSIPVLMFHSITDVKGNELQISKERFREEMQYLKDKGYTSLTLTELYNFFENNKPVPQKSVVITFDDGYVDNYTNAYPILKEFGFKATIFDITGTVDKYPAYLTSAQLKELDSNGIDIEPHTVNHPELIKLSYGMQYKELKDSKDFLEKLLGKTVKFVAYPDGEWNQDTIKAVKDIGYTMAFTTAGTWANKQNGIYTLYRVYISANFGMDEFNRRMTQEHYK